MKLRMILKIVCASLAVVCVLSLVSCGKDDTEPAETTDAGVEMTKPSLAVDDSLAKFTYDADSDIYTDTTTKNTYKMASVSYEPVTLAVGYGTIDGHTLYRLDGCAETDYLSLEYTGIGEVFYGTDITLPTLAEMNPTSVQICDQKEIVVGVGTINDKAIIDQMVSLLTTAPGIEMPRSVATTYRLKFVSPELSMLYYSVTYFQGDDGTTGLSDRGTGRIVEIGDLLKDFID